MNVSAIQTLPLQELYLLRRWQVELELPGHKNGARVNGVPCTGGIVSGGMKLIFFGRFENHLVIS